MTAADAGLAMKAAARHCLDADHLQVQSQLPCMRIALPLLTHRKAVDPEGGDAGVVAQLPHGGSRPHIRQGPEGHLAAVRRIWGSWLVLHMQAGSFSAAAANMRGRTLGQYLAAAGCILPPLSSRKPASGPAYASFAILVSAGQGAAEQGSS